jgi:ribonuclease HI
VWKLYVDGSSNKQCSGAGIILISPDESIYEYALKFNFKATNNVAEYEALIAGLQLAKELGAHTLHVYSDSQLVVGQVTDEFQTKGPKLSPYVSYAKLLLQHFEQSTIERIPRAKNTKADALARLATAQPDARSGQPKVEVLDYPSINKTLSEVFSTTTEDTWMKPILDYLSTGAGPTDRVEYRRLALKSAHYLIRDGRLYRRGLSMPNLICITSEEGLKVLREIHGGICGNHSGARSLAQKTLRYGYFWLTLSRDAHTIASTCHKCQQYANIPRQPAANLTVLISPWPFAQWGLDLIGKLPTARGQFKYVVVAVDYNTKWVEAEALTFITTAKIEHFLWKNIYCRFGTPDAIITDNGSQFDNDDLRSFTSRYGTRLLYASPAHPQTNGQVEAINKILKKTLKKKLDDAQGLWAEKLPEVLWSYRTTTTETNGETPFCMAFGTEAVIPVELQYPTERVIHYDSTNNSPGLDLNTDLLEERREAAHFRNIQNKQRLTRYYNSRVSARPLKLGDWVMKEVIPPPTGLKPTWEGPFEIVELAGPYTFYIRSKEGHISPHPWNVQHLRYYYK